MKKQKILLLCIAGFLVLCLAGMLAAALINAHVKNSVSAHILTPEQTAEEGEFDAILVLGCKVDENGNPSNMLRDRLDTALSLYRAGLAPKLLMSGDHGQKEYNEVGAMKRYALEQGVPSEDVFMDHAGFSTYESIYRAIEVFHCERVLIVTQEYHLYRALYIARQLGLEARGVSATLHEYGSQSMRDVREFLARNKDFFSCVFRPLPTYLGEAIPITASGDLTNDSDGAFQT